MTGDRKRRRRGRAVARAAVPIVARAAVTVAARQLAHDDIPRRVRQSVRYARWALTAAP